MYLVASQEVQFDVELYMTVFQFGELTNEAVDFLEWQENQKASFFANKHWKKLIQVESPYNQTPLNYANPHAQVIVSSLTSPHPSRRFQ